MDSKSGVSNYEVEVLETAKFKESAKDVWKSGLHEDSMSCVNAIFDKQEKQRHGDSVNDSFLSEIRKNFYCMDNGDKCVKYNLLGNNTDCLPSSSSSGLSRFQIQIPSQPKNSKTSIEVTFDSIPKNYIHKKPLEESLKSVQCFKRKQEFLDNKSEDKRVKGDSVPTFHTAKLQLVFDNARKFGKTSNQLTSVACGNSKKSLGGLAYRRNMANNRFNPPLMKKEYDETALSDSAASNPANELMFDDRLKNIDAKMVEMIMNEIMDDKRPVTWDDIAGLDFAKKMVKEMVVLPMIRPDFCTRLRRPPKGLLLFGPPGTGKTLIGKVIASNSKSTFFSISASSLTSKWIGEGEKMVRALFAVAKCHQPAVIFIDEVDSLLSQRNDSEHEASRRIKTEFLVQLDGANSLDEDKILVIGATNRPQELDEAARRRLSKRLYIPLPELVARVQLISSLMKDENHILSDDDIMDISRRTDGYSGADMTNLCKEAAYGPIRELSFEELENLPSESVRPVNHKDFHLALSQVKASVSKTDLRVFEDWNEKFGSTSQHIQ